MGKKSEHHGGAWKVAYADFVTSMMALFMVLWICAQNIEVRVATSKYFKEPYTAFPDRAPGMLSAQMAGAERTAEHLDPTAHESQGFLKALAREFYRLLNVRDDEERPVDVEVTSDGLKITVYDRAKKPVFKKDTAELTEWGNFVVQTLAWLVERHKFQVFIEGHTALGMVEKQKGYGPWELSADRANTTRRGLEFFAVNPKKINRVTGFGETMPLPNQEPASENNQRVTVSLSIRQQEQQEPATTPPPASN